MARLADAPATGRAAAQTRPVDPRYLPWLALLVVAAIAVNAAGVLLVVRGGGAFVEPRAEQSPRLVAATALADGRVVAATVTDELVLFEAGERIGGRQLPAVIGGIAAAPGGETVYVGRADGRVDVLSPDLSEVGHLEVKGRVVAVAAPPADGVVVGHGQGAFSPNYWVSYFPAPDQPATFAYKTDFTIGDVAATREAVVYSTLNGRVGAVGLADGQRRWLITASRPVLSLDVDSAGGRVLTGDDRGNVALRDGSTGDALWQVRLTEYKIRRVMVDSATGTYLATDVAGGLYALGAEGQRLFGTRVGASQIESFIPDGDGLIAIPREGAWLNVRPGALTGVANTDRLRQAWYVADAVLVALIVASAIGSVPHWRAGAGRLAGDLRRSVTFYVFTLPAIALIVVFGYYPAATAFYYAFTDFNLARVTEWVGFENFVRIIRDDFYFRVGFGNMVLLLVTGVVKVLTVPLLAAELVFWLKNHTHRYIFRTLIVVPTVVPGLVLTLLWRMIYQPETGLLNQILHLVGLGALERAWLGDEQLAIWAVIFTGFPFLGAFSFLIYLGGLLNINADLYDAAQIDGADWRRRFWHIDVPLLEPQFRLLLFFAFAGAIQDFASIFILTRGGPGSATYVPALQMYLSIVSGGNYGYASAIGVILFALIFIGTVLLLRLRREPLATK